MDNLFAELLDKGFRNPVCVSTFAIDLEAVRDYQCDRCGNQPMAANPLVHPTTGERIVVLYCGRCGFETEF